MASACDWQSQCEGHLRCSREKIHLLACLDLRMAAHADLDGSMMGIPNAYIAMGIKYMTTVHIKASSCDDAFNLSS